MYQSKHKGQKIDSAIDKVPVLEEELNQTVSRVQNMENGIADNKSRINEIEVSKGQPNGYASLNSEGNIFLEQIADGAITTSKIGKNAVGTDNIKDAAVDSAKITNGSIAARHIIDGQVTRDKIAPDSISSDKLANKSVTTEKIADVAVTTEKIKDGAVTSDKLVKKISVEEVNVSERVTAYSETATPSKATQDKLNITAKEVSLEHKEYSGAGDLTSIVIHKLTEKINKSDLTADNIISVYSSKLKPNKYVNKPSFPEMTGTSFFTDIARVIDVGGAYAPEFTVDYVWENAHQNITSTTYFVNYDTGSSSATGLNPSAALKYPSDAMTKAKNGDIIVIMGGYYPRNQLGFDQKKSVHIQGGIFCNADNNRSLTWTLVEGSTYKTTRSQAYAVWQAIKDGSEFSELLPTPTLARCKSTNGSYFIDGDTVYVNTPSGYSGAPGYDILVSLNAVGATINTNVWCENTVFVFGGHAACLNRSSTDPALFSDCTFKYAKQNGFMSQGGKSYLLNCESYNNGRDGFSYKKLNSNVSYGFEVGCTAHHNGDNESTGSDNGSTAHEGSIVTRINGKYYENKGPNIADVNPGTMSYNLNCACSNSTATAQDRRIDFNIEDGTMYLDRCTSDGSFISLYEASVTMPQTTKSYNLGSVLPGVYRVKNVNGVAENLSGGEDIANKVKSISSRSTDVQYPSAKAVNDVVSAQKTDMVQNYANALKGKVSGNNAIRIDDSSPVEHEMNVRVSSKNVIPYPYAQTTKTEKGITFTDNGDGTITVNGTATGDTSFTLLGSPISLSEGSYVLSGTPNGSLTTYYIQAYIDGKYGKADYAGQTAIYNANKGQKLTQVELYVKNGATFDNLVSKPQFERGTTATDYAPYVDPTSVTLSECGKNLIPYPYTSSTITNNGITFVANNDGTITVNGTATSTANFQFIAQTSLPLRKGKYTLSSGLTTDNQTSTFGLTLGYKYANGTRQTLGTINGKNTVTLTADALCDFVVTVRANQTLKNVTFKPQFEMNSIATEYEAYKAAKTFTPSADGTVTGVKNIYPTTSLLSNRDNVVIDVEYNRDINNPDVFEDYVKFTDYAGVNKSGVVSLRDTSQSGLAMDIQNYLKIVRSSNEDIDAKTNLFKPIVPANLDYAVRSVLPKVNTSIGDSIVKNCVYDLGEQTSLSITLPATGNVGDWLQFDFMSGSTATTLAIASTAGILGYDLIPEINTIYSLYLDWGIIGKSDTGSTYGWRFSYSEYPVNA